MERVSRRARAAARPPAGPRDHAQPAEALQGAAPRRADGADHGLPEHDRRRERARVPRRRGARAPLPRLDPLERRDHRAPRPAPRHRRRRSHLDLRLERRALRGRAQPLLPRSRPPQRRRLDLLPGPRLPRHVRPRLPRGPPRHRAARRVPAGEVAPDRGPLQLPAPAPHAALLAVPHGLDGSRARSTPSTRRSSTSTSPTAASSTATTRRSGRSSATARWTRSRAAERCSSPRTTASTTSTSSSTATCSASTAPCAATARSSRSSRASSAAPAGTSSRSSGAASGMPCSPRTTMAPCATS